MARSAAVVIARPQPRLLALLVLLAPSPAAAAERCGDGQQTSDEACDLGIGNEAGRACTPSCEGAACGDGVVSLDEACDDGNVLGGDGCSATCRDERAPRWMQTMDRGALDDEWLVDVAQAGGRYYVLHQKADAWQTWASTVASHDPSGLLWEVSNGPPETGRFDALAVSGDAVVLVGHRRTVSGGIQGALAAFGLGGAPRGESLLADVETLTVVEVAPDGDLLLGGTQRQADPDPWFGRYDLRTDTTRWSTTRTRPGSGDIVRGLAFREDLGLYYAGEAGRDTFVVRLDARTGATVWDVLVPAPEGGLHTHASGLAITDTQVFVAGNQAYEVTSEYGLDTDGWVAAFTLDGAPLWERFDGGPLPASDGYLDVVGLDDGSAVVAGYRHHPVLATYVDWDVDAVLVQYDPEGNRGAELSYDGPLHLEDYFGGILRTDDGLVTIGQSFGLHAREVGLLAAFDLPEATPSRVRTGGEDFGRPPAAPAQLAPTRAETVYVNFGGASLRPGADGRRGEITCADGPFDFPGLDADRTFVESTMARVELLLEPFDVEVVWEAPPPDALPYTTVLVGGKPEQIGVGAMAAGFSCQIDCGNARANELVFAFETSASDALANTIVHEAAHAWGLDHVVDPSAVMSPFAFGSEAVLRDGCIDISDETSTPACLDAHAEFCPPGQQDAHAELSARLGERRVDVTAPEIFGLPSEDITVGVAEAIPFALTVEDDSASPGVELRIEALGVRRALDPGGLSFEVFLPEGTWTLEFAAIDHAGNEALAAAVVHVEDRDAGEDSGGSSSTGELPDEAGETDDAPQTEDRASPDGCACSSDGGTSGLGWLWLLALPAGRRAPRLRYPRPR